MKMSNEELEILIQKYMKKLELTRDEAYQLVLDDNSKEMTPEQIELTQKALAMGRHYETSTKERKKSA